MKIEPEAIIEKYKELKKDQFFRSAIKFCAMTALISAYMALVVWVLITDKLY